jgi:hypothetical protein
MRSLPALPFLTVAFLISLALFAFDNRAQFSEGASVNRTEIVIGQLAQLHQASGGR